MNSCAAFCGEFVVEFTKTAAKIYGSFSDSCYSKIVNRKNEEVHYYVSWNRKQRARKRKRRE